MVDIDITEAKVINDSFDEVSAPREPTSATNQDESYEIKKCDVNFFSEENPPRYDSKVYSSAARQKINEILAPETAETLTKRIFGLNG